MVTRFADREVIVKEHVFNGEGKVVNRIITPSDVMYGKNRLFQVAVLEKGSEIGYHTHIGDGEVYYILHGEGEFNDNGTVVKVAPGDVCWTPDGEGHSIKGISEEPLEFVALIVYSK